MRRLASIALALLLPGVACGPPPGEGGYEVRGVLSDAETGERVSRESIYVHLFCDDVGHQLSLDPSSRDRFEARVPRPTVRVRVADTSDVYELWERTLEVGEDGLDLEVELVPTGWVLVHGRVIGAEPARPGEIGGNIGIYFSDAAGRTSGPVWPDDDRRYAVRLPREKHSIATVNTAKSPRVREIDLGNLDGDEFELDLEME